MSSPSEFYKSLPPITKAYGTICLMTTVASHLGLYRLENIALIHELVFSEFQVWRLLTNFFFLGNFSMNFGIRLLMIARYGVQLEQGPFQRRTADFLWMMIFGAISLLVCIEDIPFLGHYQLFQFYGVHFLAFHWYSCFYTSAVGSFLTLKSIYMDLLHSRPFIYRGQCLLWMLFLVPLLCQTLWGSLLGTYTTF
ncbi:hypothetical protein V6Z12_A05G047800 [Gossypium hirsutum]